jgi:hypothetical protein
MLVAAKVVGLFVTTTGATVGLATGAATQTTKREGELWSIQDYMSCAKKNQTRYLPKVGPAEGDVVGSKLGSLVTTTGATVGLATGTATKTTKREGELWSVQN